MRATSIDILLGMILALVGGCASGDGPPELVVAPAQYGAAFDAAVEVARREGMPAILRDRRTGVIETDSRIAGSAFEPWRGDAASFSQGLEQTMQFERRRIRFEFAPVERPPVALDPAAPLTGGDVTGLAAPGSDLTTHAGDLRLVAVVTIEQGHHTGQRRSNWSRRYTTHFSAHDDPPGGASLWTTVARDEAFERRLLASIEAMLTEERPPINTDEGDGSTGS